MLTKLTKGDDRGQTLIQLALVLVVLLGFAALAIDLGYGYLERRRMQNAADAGALAGAYALCKAEPVDAAIAKAKLYMTKNGVKAADIAAGDVKVTGGVVSVQADTSLKTSLASTFGFSTLNVAASAKATCGAANSACGLWPIAFEHALYVGAACGQRMVIWDADLDEPNTTCEIGGVTHPFCDCYQCKDEDGPLTLFTDTGRGWLDFSASVDPLYPDACASNGCGTSELTCRLKSGSSAPIYLPACIAGLRGVKAGAKSAIDGRAGDLVRIPLFDGTCSDSGNVCTGKEAEAYHIVQFGCVSVNGWVQQLELNPKPGMPPEYKKIKSKAIIVSKTCGGACETSCGSTDGSLPEAWELRAVGLTK